MSESEGLNPRNGIMEHNTALHAPLRVLLRSEHMMYWAECPQPCPREV